jgi:hypothetical protein
LPGNPRIADVRSLISELPSNEQDKKILEAISSSDIIGRSLLAPPGFPPARRAALRKAFMDAVNDDLVHRACQYSRRGSVLRLQPPNSRSLRRCDIP